MDGPRRSLRLEAKRSATVDVLPDEMLTLVFSKLTDGRTLLDAVPLVCKRWCRVARDPTSWAGVRLKVKSDVADEARILRYAPAARSLEIDAGWARRSFIRKAFVRRMYAPDGPYGPTNRCRLRAALRFSSVAVRDSVTILEKGWWVAKLPKITPTAWKPPATKKPKSSIARFLARQPHLRELRLFLAAEAEGRACLAAVARMRRLTKLELTTLPGAAYDGELAAGLPELRELRLHARCPRDTDDPEVPCGLVGDLVRGAPNLRVLEVDMPVASDKDACAALRGVERVAINAFQDDLSQPRPVGQNAVGAVRRAFALLLRMKTPALRSAAVSLCRGEHARFSAGWRRKFNAVRNEFALQMPDVDVKLDVDGSDCDECGTSGDCPGLGWWSDEENSEDSDSDFYVV